MSKFLPLRVPTPNRDERSADDVLARLRDCADDSDSCMEAMIAEDTPTLRAVNPVIWIQKTDYLDLEFKPSLRRFAAQRADLMHDRRHWPLRIGWHQTL